MSNDLYSQSLSEYTTVQSLKLVGMCNRLSTSVASVSVLKDTLLSRSGGCKDQCFSTNDEIETIIQAVCIE